MAMTAPLVYHHTGYATKTISPSADLYVARYGYEKSTEVIHDPLQTALVQFLQLPGDRSYLEFVAPDGVDSMLTEAVRRRGGLNHLCYTCGVMEQAIRDLGQTGMRLIVEPRPGIAFGGRRICWMIGEDPLPIELVERKELSDLCRPGV